MIKLLHQIAATLATSVLLKRVKVYFVYTHTYVCVFFEMLSLFM